MKNFTRKTWFRLICISAFALLAFALIMHEKTEEFLPKPDTIMVQFGTEMNEIKLSDEQADWIYGAFQEMVASGVSDYTRYDYDDNEMNNIMLNWALRDSFEGKKTMTMTFQYSKRYRYTGDLGKSEESALGSAFTFDKIMFSFESARSVSVYPSQYGFYYGIDRAIPRLVFQEDVGLMDAVIELMAENITQVERTTEGDIEESDALFLPPDDIVLVKGGEKASLTEKDKEKLYAQIKHAISNLISIQNCNCVYSQKDMLEYLTYGDEYIYLELLYKQPQRFTGTLSGKPSELKEEWLVYERVITQFEYDSLVIIFQEGVGITIYAHCNGRYFGFQNRHYYLGIKEGKEDLKALVRSYVQ